MARWTFLSMLAGGLLFASCGESDNPSSDVPATTGQAAVDEIVAAYCGTVRSCCLAAGRSTAVLGDCEAKFSQVELFRAALAGTVVFRERERSECVTWLHAVAGSCVLADDSPCSRMQDGTLGEGAACEDSLECQRPAHGVACLHTSDANTASERGVCRALSAGQLGAPCFATIEEDGYGTGYSTDDANPSLGVCDRREGLFCDYSTHTCQRMLGAGQACPGFEGCADGLYCDETCLPKTAAGGSCEFFDQCAGDLSCVNGTCAIRKITDGDLCEGDYD